MNKNTDQNFSMIHFLSLLEKKENQVLSDSEEKELDTYQSLLDSQLNYNTRFQYLSLFQEFLDGKKDLDRFFSQFTSLYFQDVLNSTILLSNREQLANVKIEFEMAAKMEKFDDRISELWSVARFEYEDEAERAFYESNYSLDVDKYSNSIRETYQQIQELLE
jgi:hypothetical protein